MLALRSLRARDPALPSYDLTLPPATFEEALQHPDKDEWLEVVRAELGTMTSMGVYKVVPLPSGRKAIGCRWVFEFKLVKGVPVQKVRLMAQGFSQIPGMGYGKMFVPVCQASSVRLLSALAARLGWHLICFDVTRAFLWGDLEEIYMWVLS